MARETSYIRMLGASVKLQHNIAIILEAKALEAEKVSNWICNHVVHEVFPAQQTQLKETMVVHDQLIEVIDGLAKLNQGMVNVLRAALRHDQGMMGAGQSAEYGEENE